ncbi:MAG TPA: AlpA family phage regulatory protein [Legionella sp.]|nr:AlpA family phage regulatory protein [Legionella sp.]
MQSKEFKQRILFIKDVEQLIGRNRLTLRRWWTNGQFPKPFKINGYVLSWDSAIIEQWISQKVNDVSAYQ